MARNAEFMEHEDGIPSYLSRLTQVPLLTASQEEELTKLVQQGNELARQRLVESNMRLVINIAKTYRNNSIPLEDLIQEGAIGLMQAAQRFDPGRGFRFSTYATHWVRQAIGRAIDNKSKLVRLPAHVSQWLRRIEKERGRLQRELGAEPTLDQLADSLGIPTRKLMTLIQSSQEMISLDMSVGDTAGSTLGGLLQDTVNRDPEALMLSEELLHELQRILCELNDREQRVMRLRFQLEDGGEVIQDDIAKEMKLSRERVRQIEMQAIKKLRALAHRRRLREILTG